MSRVLRVKISTKVLLYFLFISLTPLIVSTALLASLAKSQLLQAATTKQQIIADETRANVDEYLATKINTLTFESQYYSSRNITDDQIEQNMAVHINQDHDIYRIALLTANGKERIVFDRNGKSIRLTDESNTDAYKAATFLSGKAFVSSVTYNQKNEPLITIALPVLKSDYSTKLSELPKANFGVYKDDSDIQGVVVADYNISQLWQSVLSTKVGNGGYAYVVDSLGNLIAHPDKKYLASHQKIADVDAVKAFINNNFDTRKTISETGTQVLSTTRKLNNSNWGVILEEPVTSVYSGVNSFVKLAVIIIVSAEILAISTAFVLRNQLVGPIKKLTFGAEQLGAGNFDHKIVITSNDELRELANTFNNMGTEIKHLVGNLETQNDSLVTEQIKLNSIISSVSDGIVALDAEGRIITINPPAAKLINKRPEELYGHTMSSSFDWEHDDVKFVPELQKPGLYHYSEIVLPRENEFLYLDLMVSVIDNARSQVKSIISIHDQTKARELDFMKLDFVAIAAHELRTPLTVIQGYLQLLNIDAVKQLSVYNIENLVKAETGANQLRDLINKLLSISRIERGKLQLNIARMNLSKLVQDTVDQQSSTAAQRQQVLRYRASTDSPVYVPGDTSSLAEVLNNLIGNALKYTPEGGEVVVKLDTHDDMVRVEIVDNGPGIPSALRSRLFTKFYRAERSLIAGTRGTGLGLFISKTIIDMHHGKIGIEPDTGKGSAFFFTLPIYNDAVHAKMLSNKHEIGGVHGWFKKHSDS